jgi:DNA-binding XRE family transcriptional regulator
MTMRTLVPPHSPLDLDGEPYVVIRRSVFEDLCRRCGVRIEVEPAARRAARESAEWAGDPSRLGRRVADRRRRIRLTQAELAEQAGIRVETLNRIERCRTNPDFGTVRRLITALLAAEAASERTAVAAAARRD